MNAYEDGPDFDFDDLYGRDPRNPENHGAPDPDPDDPGPQPDDIRDEGYGPEPEPEPEPDDPYAEDEPPKVAWTVAASLAGKPVPPREWIIDEWLPVGTVTSLIGAGGVGKSLTAQQLATAVSLGHSFFGLPTMQCRVLGIFCEDDGDELHRRQAAICTQYVEMDLLKDFIWTARAGEQNGLVHENPVVRGMLDWSGLFCTIEEQAKSLGARLIILDIIAQMYGANENDRALVTSFVNRLHKLAYEINGAVLLLGHPGKGARPKSGAARRLGMQPFARGGSCDGPRSRKTKRKARATSSASFAR